MMQVRKTWDRPLQLSLHYDRCCSSHSSRKPMLNTSCEEKLKSNLTLGKCAHANYILNVCVHVSYDFEWGSVNCELTRWEHWALTVLWIWDPLSLVLILIDDNSIRNTFVRQCWCKTRKLRTLEQGQDPPPINATLCWEGDNTLLVSHLFTGTHTFSGCMAISMTALGYTSS